MTPSLRRAEEAVIAAAEKVSNTLRKQLYIKLYYDEATEMVSAMAALSALRASQAGEPCPDCRKPREAAECLSLAGYLLWHKGPGTRFTETGSFVPTPPAEEAKPKEFTAMPDEPDDRCQTCLGEETVDDGLCGSLPCPSCAQSTEKGGERK